MTKVTLDVPTLWADHHVLKVREALFSLDGVDDVVASSAWKQVLVTYNSKKTKKAEIEKALTDADGDGIVEFTVHEYGVDDRVEVPSYVCLEREPDGKWQGVMSAGVQVR